MSQVDLCGAIKAQRLIRFYYSLDKEPGFRTVEPHMVARTKTEALALSAWHLSGTTTPGQGPDWRIYLLSGISQVTVLQETFDGPRDGYKADGGRSFHYIQCGLS